jgi:hypothetical protein
VALSKDVLVNVDEEINACCVADVEQLCSFGQLWFAG